ncbi:MAG: phosphoribosylamine--glycine ligase [Verrucomicrobiota bacterium]
MKVIVVGKGGREHVLVRSLHDAPSKPEMYCFPGSDGMGDLAQRVDVGSLDELIEWMKQEEIDLCVAGEESYLAKGLADRCRERGIRCWGPVQASAQLESSKIFAKEFMTRNEIPTGGCDVVETPEELRTAVTGYPTVLKYDGLAAGKGVSVCFDEEQVEAFIADVFNDRKFGEGRVLVEEFLEGKEVSVIAAVADGQVEIFTPARDYKRQLDNDEGPNTGGMGAVASRALIPDAQLKDVEEKIVKPTVEGLVRDKLDYRGFLYFGIMFTEAGPKVLEYNCRFGDPEAQAILPLVGGDLTEFLYEGAAGTLDASKLQFDTSWSICLVLASKDYPYQSGRGEIITGLDEVEDGWVFHAGTALEGDNFIVNGGRVLSVVCKGATREEALEKVYREIKKVHFDGAQHRTDIGRLHFEEIIKV